MRYSMMSDGGGEIPADLEKDPAAAAASASSTSANSYTKTVRMSPVVGKTYKFWFTYLYEDPETKKISESENSPVFKTTFDIPNGTLPVENLLLTPGIKSYGVKFNINPASVQTDIIIYESLTGTFTGEEYIVFVGTSTNVTIQVDSFAPRWVKVTVRDNWLDANRSSVIAGPVSILTNNPDTSTPPKAPAGVQVSGAIDPEDKSGFSIQMDVSWTASTDTNTNGYVIRWSANNPSTTANPLWEYGQVDGRATNKFSITGLTPNTVYYWQVTAKSPFNAISWDTSVTGQVASGQFGPISDPNAPEGNIQLRSIISIGGKSADLFKIGTGITQSINTSTTITPSLVPGTYNGIILDRSTTNFGHNYWLNTGQFRVGSSSSFLYWDGANIYTTGKINATGGSFTGDVRLNGGTLHTGATPTSGARIMFNSSGLFGYNSSSTTNETGQTFALTAADGKIDAKEGYVGGWTIFGSAQAGGSIYSNNTKLESRGVLTIGDNPAGSLASIVRLSAVDPNYRIWVGSQDGSNAKFKVGIDGTLHASNAVLSVSSGGVYDSIVAAQQAAIAANGTATGAATTADGKNSIFRTGSTPTALKAGDIWINSNDANKLYVATAPGTLNWVLSRDTAIQAAVDKADSALEKATAAVNTANNAYPASNFSKSAILQAINASTNGATLSGGVLEAGTVLADNVVSTYVYAGFISADKINAGTLQGRDINVTGENIGTGTFDSDSQTYGNISSSSNALTTMYTRTPIGGYSGVKSVGVNAIALISTATAGVTSSWYPYYDGAGDLGIKAGSTTSTYRWRNLRLTGDVYIGGDGSTNAVGTTAGPIIRLLNTGRIYANTLGSGSGGPIVQDSNGYIRVSSSSRRYKENILPSSESLLNDVLKINPVTFSYKEEFSGLETNPTLYGLIAEEVDEIQGLKKIINYNLEGTPESISYDKLSVVLAVALKELSEKVDSISSRLDALEG